ncbi:hypothetical protein M1563_02485 [Patescibacteria group bacterium]|nr:hypothetical protein [Patescibacteria group bacterium]
MNMRSQFVATVENLLHKDSQLVLLLGDIGVWGFRNAFTQFPQRVFNIGILEQATVSVAAGLAKTGLIPVVHTIAPFLVERAFEQLKDDFGYQQLGGNFVGVGASYDYASLGGTHHCPADVGVLKNIPGMEIVVPGTAAEFDKLFRQAYNNGHPTYFRLSERANLQDNLTKLGRAKLIKRGSKATIIAVGPMLAKVLEASEGLDVSILYYSTVYPFDSSLIRTNCSSGKILLCEPYYEGVLANDIYQACSPQQLIIDSLGVPHHFLTNYGSVEEQDQHIGWTVPNIKRRLKKLISI